MSNFSESRIKLQTKLESILGSRNVYFQPPETIKMQYPAIVYSLSDISTNRADNRLYKHDYKFEIMYISKNPEDEKIMDILQLPKCTLDRHYSAENLYHTVYTLYYK